MTHGVVHWADLSVCPKWHVDRCAVFAQGVPLLYNAPLHFPQFLSLVTLTFVIDIQTHPNKGTNTLPGCEFGANPFSDSGDISYTNKKVIESAKNKTLCSSLRVVITNLLGRRETECKLIDESTDYSGFRGGGFPRQRQPLSRTVRVGGDE